MTDRRPVDLYAAAGVLLLALYTNLNVLFVVPVYAVVLLAHRGAPALRDRHVPGAAGVATLGIIPLAFMTWKFGQANIASVASISDMPSRDSLAPRFFYLKALPAQAGWLPYLP